MKLINVFLAIGMMAAIATACHQKVPTGVPTTTRALTTASEADLTALVICHDTLGRVSPAQGAPYAVTPCTPCVTYAMQQSADLSIAHARRLWLQGARAPYDSLDMGAGCARRAYRIARALRPDDDSLAVEIALVELANSVDSSRARALRTIDSLIQKRVSDGQHAAAVNMMSQFALGMWDRAQRQLERPEDVAVDAVERRAHQLAFGAPSMTQLPRIPETSKALGVSEAEWSARLFDAAARMTNEPRDRSHFMRLSLAPWVVLEDWAALDSAAIAMLQRVPNDSAVLPARALAAFRTMSHPVLSAAAVMARFDSAVAHLPRADSLRMDSFDGVLTKNDDEWRYGFLPDVRMALDRRGWSVIDPMWSTPVNEIRLSRRARVAEADFRYADIAKNGESGSETQPGQMLLRRGPPRSQWDVYTDRYRGTWLQRSWRGLTAHAQFDEHPQNWRMFYGSRFTPARASQYKTEASCTAPGELFPTLYKCALAQRAEWTEVPFYGRTDDIDVTVARFRSRGDSADVYIGARFPLRAFRSRDDNTSRREDRIEVGAWLTSEFGVPMFHESTQRELPPAGTLHWTQQWRHRAGSLRMMHRVEAMEPRQPAGARGVARFTTDAQVTFPLRGFGMSDVLIAASAAPRQGAALRWSDLEIKPNGASIAPDDRFAMVWEVYDLVPDANNRVRWRVRIKRESGNMVVRADMQRVLTGSDAAGSRIIAGESSAPDASYERDASAAEVVLDNINFALPGVTPGYHVVNVTIDDLVSGKSVTRGVSVRVLFPESQKRGTKIGTPGRQPAPGPGRN